MKPLALTFIAVALLAGMSPAYAQLAPAFQKLELIEEIDVSQAPREADGFRDYPAGISQVTTVLGGKVRVLPNNVPGVKFFGYRLGKGKNLKAGGAYVLEVVYPEDAPRSLFVANNGCETVRGFHTGRTLGDALKPLYVSNNSESLDVPLSNRFEQWQTLFHLHDRYPVQQRPRGDEHVRDSNPAEGFWIYIGQFTPEQDPLSQGAAVSKIRLYKAPELAAYTQKLNMPPEGLPRRLLFYREEMADGVIDPKDPAKRGLNNSLDWFEYKARLMNFLGMNTFAKDLLEFGANQGWDSDKFGGNEWVYQTREPQRWAGIVDIAARHHLGVLPYYEYAGSKGVHGLGNEKRATPLKGQNYTHISWTETARADLTDPDTFEDFRKMLEITIVDQKDRANFVGAWIRPRSSQLPISFGDKALERFTTAKAKPAPVTREQLQDDKALYDEYIAWWNDQRKAFLNKVRDYLRSSIGEDALVFYTADPTEPGQPPQKRNRPGLVADTPETAAAWKAAGKSTVPLSEAISHRWQHDAMTGPVDTWGEWEWQHAVPNQDPANYKNNEGVLPTFSFNRAYTVGDAAALEEFETPSGLAMIRSYSLNEHMFRSDSDRKNDGPLGYFVVDMERTGPFVMLAEARAMANGNPRSIGYLAANSFNRGFPQYVRNFNAAFLSLPALPSSRVPEASPDPDVVVRKIDAGAHGTYYAVVNTGFQSKKSLKLNLAPVGRITNAATGEQLTATGAGVSVDLYPCQLLALRIANP
jgi:hypothetical protein